MEMSRVRHAKRALLPTKLRAAVLSHTNANGSMLWLISAVNSKCCNMARDNSILLRTVAFFFLAARSTMSLTGHVRAWFHVFFLRDR